MAAIVDTCMRQFTRMDSIYRVINVALFILYSLLEVTRLYAGYAGNLAEKVSPTACP